mmetsp:Transcript_17648/g.30397  ORF Transcript_17648/g.30397 Transcript_17648/m.30397 type:complete len:245 (+) Transcript_17648:39-773(+)
MSFVAGFFTPVPASTLHLQSSTCSRRRVEFAGSSRISGSKRTYFEGRRWKVQSPVFQKSPETRDHSSLVTVATSLKELKEKLIELVSPTDKGAEVDEEAAKTIDFAIRSVEALNPTPDLNTSSGLNGSWNLIYTTSDYALGKNRPSFLRPKKLTQLIDTEEKTLINQEMLELMGFKFPLSVEATWKPMEDRRLELTFERFNMGTMSFKTGDVKGWMDVTFLDDDLRMSRGNRDNVFVFQRAPSS